jgi:hypothetical protein
MKSKSIGLAVLLILGGCSVESTTGTNFRNPQTGQVATACGPLQGFSIAVDEAQSGCAESYEKQGWVETGKAY